MSNPMRRRTTFRAAAAVLTLCLLALVAAHAARVLRAAPAVQLDDRQLFLPVLFTPAPRLAIDPIALTQCEVNSWTVSWTDAGSPSYTLQESQSDDFSGAQEIDTAVPFHTATHPPSIANIYSYRVRANVAWGAGQWSDPRSVQGNFLDDFADTSSDWPVQDLGIVAAGFVNGQYFIKSRDAQGRLYSALAPDAARENVVVEADLSFAPGSATDGIVAVIFGAQGDQLSYYFIAVYPGLGRVRVYYYDAALPFADRLRRIAEQNPSPHVRPGTEVNRVKVWRIGDQIRLELNGALIGTWTDAARTGSRFAGVMMTPNPANPVAEMRVDNFRLSACNALTGRAVAAPAVEQGLDLALPAVDLVGGAVLLDWE